VNLASSKVQKHLSLVCAMWLAVASCAFGCAQTIFLPSASAIVEADATMSQSNSMQMGMEHASCHQAKDVPSPTDGKRPRQSQALSCCPLEATLAHKTQTLALHDFATSGFIATAHKLGIPEFTIDRALAGQRISDGRDTHTRLHVFRI
jgi:hypothetical protein